MLAEDYAGVLDARTLLRIGAYPRIATVQDTTGASRPDSTLTILGGRFVAFFDPVQSTNTAPVMLQLGATTEEWDPTTATWDLAIDTINDQRSWAEAGGGLGNSVCPGHVGSGNGRHGGVHSGLCSDCYVDRHHGPQRGARIAVLDSGERLALNRALIRLDARPSSNPDTIIELTATTRGSTFIYSPYPQPPPAAFGSGVRRHGARFLT